MPLFLWRAFSSGASFYSRNKLNGVLGDEWDAKENQIKVDFFPRARNK
jgi:hypothetical protein